MRHLLAIRVLLLVLLLSFIVSIPSYSAPLPPRVYLPHFTAGVHDTPMLEVRALWVTRWDYSSADGVRTIVRKAAQYHFNVVWFQVRGQADAFYRSNLEPWATRLTGELGKDPGWDPLAVAIDEAHQQGIELHAYINVYPAWLGSAPPSSSTPPQMYGAFNSLYDDLWVMWHDTNGPMGLRAGNYIFANPAYPPVADHIAAVVDDLLSQYKVDGLHLDYIRYAGPDYSFDPKSETAYAEAKALAPSLTRAEWQRQQISRLVGQLHSILKARLPDAWLSAAVWPAYQDRWDWWDDRYPDGYSGYYQDSVGWLLGGQTEAIAPMMYTGNILNDPAGIQTASEPFAVDLLNDLSRYQILLDDFLTRAPGYWVLPGIYGDYPSFQPIADRIRWAREAGARGHAIFSYALINQRDYWDDLIAGPYRRPAEMPPLYQPSGFLALP